MKPTNKEELVEGIHKFWETVGVECYIDHLQRVLREIVRREGKASGY